jgi:hypothetical protein
MKMSVVAARSPALKIDCVDANGREVRIAGESPVR